MGSRWFYILLANIALLSANVWLFADKAQPTANPVIDSAVTTPISKVDLFNIPTLEPLYPRSNLTEISSVDSFHFPLMEPWPSKEQQLHLQLNHAQKTINTQNKMLQKSQQENVQQSQQLTSLKMQTNTLQQQLLSLESLLLNRDALIANQQQKISSLKIEHASVPLFQSEIARVKDSIDSKPDIIKSNTLKKEPLYSNEGEEIVLADEPSQGIFSGSMEFGFSYEKDNQETRSLEGRLVLDYEKLDKFKVNSDLTFEFEDEDKDMTTEKYRWQLQYDYNLDPDNLVFARSDISRSEFSSYKTEDIFTVGYGHVFFNTETHKLNIDVGPGYRFSTPNFGKKAVSVDEFIMRTRFNYERVLSESLRVKMDGVLEIGHSNSIYSLGFKAQNRIYQELYLIFDFKYKFTQNVPIDTVNEEISSGLSLLYAF